MVDPLRTLVVAADPETAGALSRVLMAAGIPVGARRAAGEEDLVAELRAVGGQGYELILCTAESDPGTIIDLVRRSDPDVPILVVGGDRPHPAVGVISIGVGEAPGGLQGIVRRELEAAETRRAARRASADLTLRDVALDSARNAIAIASPERPELPLRYVNRAWVRLSGRTEAELLRRDMGVMAGEGTDRDAMEAGLTAVRQGREHEGTMLAYRADGTTFWAQLTFTPVRAEDGEIAHWVIVMDDVTDHVTAQDRLAAVEHRHGALLRDLEIAEERYRELVEQIPAVTYIADWSPTPALRYVSPQIEVMLGWPPAAFLHDRQLWYQRIHPEDRDRVATEERRVFELGEQFDCEFRMVARDGREVWIWERDTIIRDEEGEPLFTQGVIVDITPLRETETALREERDRAQRYLDVAGTAIVVLDPDGRVALLNRTGHRMLGYRDGELLGVDWFERCIPEHEREATKTTFTRMLAGELEPSLETHENGVLTADGEIRTIAWHNTVLRDERGRITATLSSGLDVTDRLAAEQQIAYLAYHDPLTGLPNRALLHEHLELALARARRQGTGVALLYLDLDDFKLVNDSLGHPAGDEVLTHVALRLGDRRRDADLLARQGGDEFLLLLCDLPRATAAATARRVGEDLLRTLAPPFAVSGAEFHIGASVGLSVHPGDAANSDELLRHADAAMYDAKAAGRNNVCAYSGDRDEPMERLALGSRLRKALARDELLLHFQPIVSPADGVLHRVEALVRWQDPFRGIIPPADFIPFAEETGLIDRIGEWVIDEVCRQVTQWRAEGLAPPAINVNVSPRQLKRADLADRLCAQLTGSEADLTVEITESAAMNDPARTEPALQALHEAGVTIAIDDFGAGYSSLTRLRQLPVQVLKIDRTFLEGVPSDPDATSIVTAMIELAAALGMVAIAEGVETEEQRRFLVERGCPLAQGFLLGRPMPASELSELLQQARVKH